MLNNRTFYWFGDSWPCGDELENEVPESEKINYAYPKLVSDHFQAKCVVCAATQASVDGLPWQFINNLNGYKKGDKLFFGLPPSSRTLKFFNGNPYYIAPGYDEWGDELKIRAEQWYKYFVNDLQEAYSYDMSINLLYLWCQELEVVPYFYNIFTLPKQNLKCIVPQNHWILDKKTALAEVLLAIYNFGIHGFPTDDQPELLVEDWKKQSQSIKEYILPNELHPNVKGHQKLASYLISILETMDGM